MSTTALTTDTFEETVTKPGITLVDWWASGADRAGCSRRSSRPPAGSTRTSRSARSTPRTSPSCPPPRISSIPTLMAFSDGILVFSRPGALPAAVLERLIQAVRDLDMDKVRADLAQPQAEGAPR